VPPTSFQQALADWEALVSTNTADVATATAAVQARQQQLAALLADYNTALFGTGVAAVVSLAGRRNAAVFAAANGPAAQILTHRIHVGSLSVGVCGW
jgi:hypothetical protein